jgi:hypothetical protein
MKKLDTLKLAAALVIAASAARAAKIDPQNGLRATEGGWNGNACVFTSVLFPSWALMALLNAAEPANSQPIASIR